MNINIDGGGGEIYKLINFAQLAKTGEKDGG